MSTRKTRTNTKQLDSLVWGKLVSKNKATSNHELTADETTIGRKSINNLVINDSALSGTHCVIRRRDGKVFLQDLSSNGTYLDSTKIGQGKEVELKHGNQVWLLHPSKVSVEKAIGYTFELAGVKEEKEEDRVTASQEELKRKVQEIEVQLKKKNNEEMKQLRDQKQKISDQSNALLKSLKDQITCCICLEVMHVPVAVHPCNHHFCGGCLSGLVTGKQQNCAQCRKQISTAQRDAAFSTLIEDYLKSHPEQKRSQAQMDDLDKTNIFTYDTINVQEVIHGKKPEPARRVVPRGRARGRAVARRGSDISASDSEGDGGRCRQCNVTRNGFQCSSTQVHVNCHSCGKAIARRDDPTLHQSCVLCDQFFCNLYYPPCSARGVKLQTVDLRGSTAKLGVQNFRGNAVEYAYFVEFIRSKRMPGSGLYDQIRTKYIDTNIFRFLIDSKIMKVAPMGSREVAINTDSSVCDNCWGDLWFQLVLRYRIDINPELPPAVSSRAPCYYGMNCSTMSHKPDHAKKLNHCGFQTKF